MATLDLKPNCECCDIDLPPESPKATICSFECTFCTSCADKMQNICKNCGGNLVSRPIRPPSWLADNPASTIRVYKPAGCPPCDSAAV